ncbi:MAG: phosphoribosylformylglycinamidine synthase subunit PurQ [Deltaproteobacteria bacterium]|nr:phosphoribosylformylglycinamidine synthase subunit PurQ [Deltaproteobacteria bacterium]
MSRTDPHKRDVRALRVHINALIAGEASLESYDILVFDGGFSWGDDHGAGVLEAVRLKYNLGTALQRFIRDGKLILGICNGFQALVNLGFLPGLDADYETRRVALTFNDCGNFRDDWVYLAVDSASPCVFTRGISRLELPVRHGEGKFYASAETIGRLVEQGQIVLRYALPDGAPAGGKFPYNPNGSLDDVAGICDPTGRIFGLMPHPEAFHHWTNHPDWTRTKTLRKREGRPPADDPPAALHIFQNAVDYIKKQTA